MPNLQDPDDLGSGETAPDVRTDGEMTPWAVPPPLWRQRRFQVAAAVGVLAAAAVGAGVLAAQNSPRRDIAAVSDADHTGQTSGAPQSDPVTAGASAASAAAAAGSTAAAGSPSASGTAAAGANAAAGTAQVEGAAAAPAPANAGGYVAPQPPLPPAPGGQMTDVSVASTGSLPKEHHTMRVVTAYGDLTGQRELAWAADSGHAVGDARCTQNFHFGANSKTGVRPTMLLCWQTSATKSVLTVAVNLDKRPSEQESVATLDAAWAKMG